MEEQLRALKRKIRRTTRDARGHRRYDEELRIEVVEYVLQRADDGCPQAAAARELGITQRTVWGWVQQMRDDVVRPVEIIEEEPEVVGTRTLRLRGGARIEGLSLDDVIALARALS